LEPAQLEAVVAAIGEALDARCWTREELGQEVARLAGAWALDAVSPAFGGQWPRWQIALGSAAIAGHLCFGPNQGSRVTFVRPDQWLSGWAGVDGTAALCEIFRRYLSAYGPATHRDFAQWFRMQPSIALALTRQLTDELEEVDVEGHRAWLLARDAAVPWPPVQDAVRLLPHFDCYVVGCHPRERLVPGDQAKRVLPHGGAGTLPVLLIDGLVAGLWQQRRMGGRLEIRVEPFQPLSAQQRYELEAASARVGEIMEAESVLTLGAINARPHL
jgi:hypothetical protein